MMYELWDTEAGKYLGRFTDEHALLTTVKALIDHYGPAGTEWLSVGRRGEIGTILPPLTGHALLAWMASLAGSEQTFVASSRGDC